MTDYYYDGCETIKETPVAGDKVHYQGETHEFGKRGRPKYWVKNCFSNQNTTKSVNKPVKVSTKQISCPPLPKGYISYDCTITPTGAVSLEEGILLYGDGRDSSRHIENAINKLHNYVSGGEGSYDSTSHGRKYETRTVGKTDILDFRPSNQRGVGRETNIKNALDKITSIDGYNIAFLTEDSLRNKSIPYYGVSSKRILKWYAEGLLGKNMQISRRKFFSLLSKE